MDAAMDYCRQIIEDMNFNKKQFRSKLQIRLLAVGGEHSIPNMGESLQPYFENVASLVIAESGHFVPEEQPVALADALTAFPQMRVIMSMAAMISATGCEYWFPAKRYGWGWGFPITWQGLLVFAGYTLLLVVGAFELPPKGMLAAYLIYVTVLSLALLCVCWLKGEPPRWRWGAD